ncbi:rho-related BTB domain-containing protein 1-like isoform X2 [Artemia franciscana]|uniref:BTB domain-containing protein n=2 Tax=Artemia franciscana TaxID=6661 RepID=A0AA88KWR3_ARTSF|nr:hypothetical protein QYM36_013771 [Artemia franciscana]KAK2710220.1 hypothetical protein QYM36_013771 [Artemia franciscana]
MDYETPHQELVKCVVVGDTAVGKTRLICARACNKQVSLSQLLTTHVPTVWAIDQYRIYKEVLERSWEEVDGVNVSLRLWDTFGDHDKDRRFSYGRSDVVLLCFSIGNPYSLRNCKVVWYPEIKKFCPNTPILLVGCKNDLRFMYKDDAYLSYFRDRSPFVRPTRECDLVMPDQARSIASDIGLPYYETSVMTYYGVNELFENAIRAALCSRRQHRFWMANLKRVQRPILQAPFCPPRPKLPNITISPTHFYEDVANMYARQSFTDVVFIVGGVGLPAHRFYLASASTSFYKLLVGTDSSLELGTRSSSDSSMVSSVGEASLSGFGDETEPLILHDYNSKRHREHFKRRSSYPIPPLETRWPSYFRELNHPAFQTISVEECEGLDHRGRPATSLQTIITMTSLVPPGAMKQCLRFLYTGQIDVSLCPIEEVKTVAEYLELHELHQYLTNIQTKEDFLNRDVKKTFRQVLKRRLHDVCLDRGLFTDIKFQLEDGEVSAHRPLLMTRCEVMQAMFDGHFRESSAKVVQMPDVSEFTFRQLIHYFYTDQIPFVCVSDCLPLLELANRFCLPRLTHLIEDKVEAELRMMLEKGSDVIMECLMLLEESQIHNAEQLSDWCLTYLACNYNTVCRKAPKVLKQLLPENQAEVAKKRWPPVWYLKDRDYYEKCIKEQTKDLVIEKPVKRTRNNSGCLCFTSKAAKESEEKGYHSVISWPFLSLVVSCVLVTFTLRFLI